jgi:hypothetical protein
MKPKERRDSGQADLLRSRLDAISPTRKNVAPDEKLATEDYDECLIRGPKLKRRHIWPSKPAVGGS